MTARSPGWKKWAGFAVLFVISVLACQTRLPTPIKRSHDKFCTTIDDCVPVAPACGKAVACSAETGLCVYAAVGTAACPCYDGEHSTSEGCGAKTTQCVVVGGVGHFECSPADCAPGQLGCDPSGGRRKCLPSRGWGPPEPCPAGTACRATGTEAICACTAATRCTADGHGLETCVDGSGFHAGASCGIDTCVGGQCRCSTPGTTCASSTATSICENGVRGSEPCPTGYECKNNACKKAPCASGQSTCWDGRCCNGMCCGKSGCCPGSMKCCDKGAPAYCYEPGKEPCRAGPQP